jgi:DNA-binding NtrC family response regulator
VKQGRFREDLYYRLRVFELAVPELRARPSDLPVLVERFLRQFSRTGEPQPQLSGPAWAALMEYPFPGNVRELQNAINHAVILARGAPEIDLQHLPPEIRDPDMGDSPTPPPSLLRAVEQFEREYIRRAMAVAGGEKKRAAQILGISRKCLYRKLGDYGAPRMGVVTPSSRENEPA